MFWYWEDYHPPHPKERILPVGMMDLTINLADEAFQIETTQQDVRLQQRIYGPMVAGARSEYFVIDTTRPASLLSVWFKPGGALPFFGVTASELHNLHLPLETLWGIQASNLYCQLLEVSSLTERFHLLEKALLVRLQKSSERHRAVDYALKIFHTQPHTQKISQVTEQIALSPPRFIQLFREDVGMTPKLFCRIQRFQRALSLITSQPATDWAEIALLAGYYDQAHFINEFQSFSGITPTAYAPQDREHNTNLPVLD